MILRDYLSKYTLLSNTYDIFDYDTLAARLRVRYGNQQIRCDVPETEIAITAQNTIDVNREYFSALFSNVVNPYETWRETDTHTDTGTENKTNSGTGNTTNAHTGTITNADTGTITHNGTTDNTSNGTTHSDNPTTSTVVNNVNAYNSATAVPRDNSNTTNTNTADTTYSDTGKTTAANTETRDTTTTQTLNNTDTVTSSNSGTEKTTRDNSGGYTKHGYNINDYIAANRAYYAAYDIVINYLAWDILVIVPDWGC